MSCNISNKQEWLKARLNGIGASEASAVMGVNPYKTNVDLYREKTGQITAKDISDNPSVIYGNNAESTLRKLFELHFPQYHVEYDEFGMISNNKDVPFAFATLDGLLYDYSKEQYGILEIKTSEPRNFAMWNEWKGKVPEHYYIQILHQFLATGFEFAVLSAELRNETQKKYIIEHYYFDRQQCETDIEILKQLEIKFWENVQNKTEPNLILPNI